MIKKLALLLLFPFMLIAMDTDDLSALTRAAGYQVGIVDKEVLRKAVAEKGYPALKAEIELHIFEKTWVSHEPEMAYKKRMPWTIVLQCRRGDGSALSERVFGRINNMYINDFAPILCGNRLNQDQKDRIDHCTSAQPTDEGEWVGEAAIVQVKTLFFDKKSLLKALEELK
jgi:hypothetical protein